MVRIPEVRYTRNLFLRAINAIYLFAFASLYIQIPGLYGKNGILPARTQIDEGAVDFAAMIGKKPTLLWLAPYLKLDTEYMMDVLALIGMFFSFTGFVSQKFCTKSTFTALWSLYYSLYQVGQTFMWFQWDILLLETGLLCILIAPFQHKPVRNPKKGANHWAGGTGAPSDSVSFWLVRWLLLRLLFSSGVIKLTSGCPTWWGLTALNVHFESMCLPTPLAWYSHHLPPAFLRLNTVFANFAEMFVPVLFIFPIRGVRLVAFVIEVFLQLAIILTGNYNFFNYLTIALCLSLLDDDFFYKSSKKSSILLRMVKWATTLGIYGGLIYAVIVLYGIKLLPNGTIQSKIMFTPEELDRTLGKALPGLVILGFTSLLLTCVKAIYLALTQSNSWPARIFAFLSTAFYIVIAVFLFADSLVPFSQLHSSVNKTVLPEIRHWHDKLSSLHLTNSYGLFRRMTGVGGRPEIIIEGAHTLDGPWLEYQFKYKPGHVNRSLPFVAPHQPRLDWQMWFAALGTYHQNPWIMSLTYRLLTGQPEVLALLGPNPFPKAPPKYLRASLYHYHYVPWSQRNSQATWTRERVEEYFPTFSKDHPPLLDYLKNFKILGADKQKQLTPSPVLVQYLNLVREGFASIEPPLLMLALFVTGLAVIFASSLIFSGGSAVHKPNPASQAYQKKQQRRKN